MKMEHLASLFLVVLLTVQNFESVQSQKRPTLNVPSEWVHSSSELSGFPLKITCFGNTKLSWKTMVDSEFYTVTENEVPTRDYSSTLMIADPVPYDTGYFNCSDESGESVSTYVYVFNNETGFVDNVDAGIVNVKLGDPIKLDCRTTLPNITVYVFKNRDEVKRSAYLFDSKTGVVLSSRPGDIGQVFRCKNNFNELERNKFLVGIIDEMSSLHQPSIDVVFNAYHVVGQSFNLNCSVSLSDEAERITFKWKTPNEQTVSKRHDHKHDKNHAISTLTVVSPTFNDSGNYTCLVSNDLHEKIVKKEIILKGSIKPFVKFEVEKDSETLSELEHKTLKWVLRFRGYPADISYTFYNKFNEKLTELNQKIETEFNYDKGTLLLKINDLGAEDCGMYRAVISLQDGPSDNTSVLVNVAARPRIYFDPIPHVFSIEDVVRIKVAAVAYKPNITWYFNTRCPMGIDSCGEPALGEKLDSTKVSSVSCNRYDAELELDTNSSGVIEAKIKTKFGENSTITDVVISDINGTLSLDLKVESQNVKVNKSQKVSVVEGDQMELTCAALDFIYDKLSLTITSEELIPEKCVHSFSLSSSLCINISGAVLNMTGNYSCSARNKRTGNIDNNELIIRVLEKTKPIILPKSNVTVKSKEVIVKYLQPFRITCYVDGLPRPKITWLKDNKDLEVIYKNEPMFARKQEGQVLEFTGAKQEFGGRYTCRAENRAGLVEHFISIAVQFKKASLTLLQWTLIILAIVCIAALCSTVGYLTLRVKKERKFREELRQNQLYLFEKGNIGNINPDCTVDEQAELLPYDKRFEVSKERIRLGKMLGCGAFGRVMEAKVDNLEVEGKRSRVAVKMCKDCSDTSQLQALTLELKIMVHLGKHLNIVNLMGAHTGNLDKGDLWILVEYCRYGNLLRFIQKYKSRFVDQIDHETGILDPAKQSHPFIDSCYSPSQGDGSYGYRRTGTVSGSQKYQNRLDSIRSNQLFGRKSSVSSNSRSVSGLSARPGVYIGNPNYAPNSLCQQTSDAANSTENKIGSSNPDEICKPLDEIAFHSKPKLDLSSKQKKRESTSSSEEVYYKALATDMTVLTSPPPYSPSSESGTFSFDANIISSDPGEIPGVNAHLTTCDLICWCWQVSNGMEYLSKRKVLHGDLAARNLLLADHNVVKISDFGLSRDMYKSDVYMKKGDGNMPIKWMSPEAIQQKIFTTQSDVWAFGITMWELFTIGRTPYPGIPLDQNFTKCLESGMVNEKPKYATNELYSLMMNCWNTNPKERPNFVQISETLADMISSESRKEYVEMNTVYMDKNEEWLASQEIDYFNMMTSPDFDSIQQSADQLNMKRDDEPYIPESCVSLLKSKGKSTAGDTYQNLSTGYMDMKSVTSSGPPSSADAFKSVASSSPPSSQVFKSMVNSNSPPSAKAFTPWTPETSENVFVFPDVESNPYSEMSDNKTWKLPVTIKYPIEQPSSLDKEQQQNAPLISKTDHLVNGNDFNLENSSESNYNKNVTLNICKSNTFIDNIKSNDAEDNVNYMNITKLELTDKKFVK